VAQEYLCSFESLEGLVYPDFGAQTLCERETASRSPLSSRPSSLVGGIDWGFRNPFAAVWGCLDADDVLTITGERYLRETPLHEHAQQLPRGATWYADPAGAQEINAFIRADFTVRKANNDIRAGIAAVHARLQTGRLKVVPERCPNLLAEAQLYRYPTRQDGRPDTETPVDENNHALAGLRYLIASIDAAFLAKFRRAPASGACRAAASGACERPGKDLAATGDTGGFTPPARPEPWLRLDNEQLWS
jgi:hypothetical protein